MPQKIFISYRRDDSAANALGVGQYLEREFGGKNVFIDVDMRAGANFPSVLEQRLAECKVMLVIIGSSWLDAKDQGGQRRLDRADDWVRLEIASALKHNIAIIPVRISGAELPPKSALPEDIQGFLDYQAISITHTGFRHEMASLVRDIRAIPNLSSRRRRRYWIIGATAFLAVMIAAVVALKMVALYRARSSASTANETTQNNLWTAKPGEWVLFATDQRPVGFYFNPNSITTSGDRVFFLARFPNMQADATSVKGDIPNSYEQDTDVIDCKSSVQALAEKVVYNKEGEAIYRFKWADPQTLDLSIGGPIASGSILSLTQHFLCDGNIKTALISKSVADNMSLKDLSSTVNGDGEILYGPKKGISNGPYTIAMTAVMKMHEDHRIADLFLKGTTLGVQATYRSVIQPLQFDCANKKVLSVLIEYVDDDNNLIYLLPESHEYEIKANPFEALFHAGCDGQVGGTYVGTNEVTYAKGGEGQQKISIVVIQSQDDLSVTFQTASGGGGKGAGTLVNNKVKSLSLQSVAAECPGSYNASLEFSGDSLKWTYQGKDCGGAVTGSGAATRASKAGSQH